MLWLIVSCLAAAATLTLSELLGELHALRFVNNKQAWLMRAGVYVLCAAALCTARYL